MNEATRGIIVKSTVVVKPGPLPAFFQRCPEVYRPADMHDYGDAYTYRYAPGRRATVADLERIFVAAGSVWWLRDGYLDRKVVADYGDRVIRLAGYANAPLRVVTAAVDILNGGALPAVRLVHGDMTFENIIINGDRVTFIDPADAHGVITPGIDRGKLLQSIVMRWEERANVPYDPWTQPGAMPPWATEVDWAFLVTHWVRLLRFWPELNTRSGFATLGGIIP